MGKGQKRRRDPMGVYALLRRLGNRGTEDELAECVVGAAAAAGLSVDRITDRFQSSARLGSEDWRMSRAGAVSALVAALAQGGRLGCLVADSGELDGERITPGTADGEGDGRRPLRYDRIYPVRVSAGGEGGTVRFAPFDGCVRIERGGRRATVVALDDLSEDDRSALARTPVRRRVEVHVRCSARGCAQAYRAFLSPPSASGDEIAVEDTSGERICGFAGLFAARCPAHRRGQGDRM